MKKKLLIMSLLLGLSLTGCAVDDRYSIEQETESHYSSSSSESSSNGYTYNKEEYTLKNTGKNEAKIIKYNGSATDLVIPEVIDGKTITSIGECAFENNKTIKSVSGGYALTTIETKAFAYCSSLEILDISGVSSFSDSVLYNASSLKSLTLNTLNYSLTTIFGVDVSEIPSSLTKFKINCNFTGGDHQKFYGLTDCLRYFDVEIGNKVESFDFSNCYWLRNVEFEEKSSVTKIARSAFYACYFLKTIVLPDSVTSIGISAFRSCSNLAYISIPSSVNSIDERAFDSCESMPCIYLPNTITRIPHSAFKGCSSLTSLYYGGSEFEWENVLVSEENEYLTQTNVVYGVVDIESKDNGVVTYLEVSNGDFYITGYVDEGATFIDLVSMFEGKRVIAIGGYSFSSNQTIESITIPESVVFIGTGAFSGSSLSSITSHRVLQKLMMPHSLLAFH